MGRRKGRGNGEQPPRATGKPFDRRGSASHRLIVSVKSSPAIADGPTAGSQWPQPTAAEQEALSVTIRAAQEGDRDAIRKFLEVVAPSVRRTCRSVLGDTHADVEDSIQESLLAAVKALPKYRFDSDVRRYVTTIALRLAINTRRRGIARLHRHNQMDEHRHEGSPAGIPGDALLDGFGLVRRILDDLSAVQSETMFMRVILGFTIDEIAVIKGVSQNTVKTRLRRGKDVLRRTGDKGGIWRRLFLGNS